ncbi:MAG: hypothetical protein KAS71_13880, partial [Bacteroidales bacterium]|nr:hypothetical protein [Bacteroidales bacterium]
MNINSTILEKIYDFIGKYGGRKHELKEYLLLQSGSNERRDRSIELIQDIMTSHGKEDLHKYISELGRIEAGIRELEPWVRDHVSHAIHCFVLGIFINSTLRS